MELSILLTKEIAVLMIIMAFGWLAIRLKLLKIQDSKALSIVTLFIICPCVIVRSFQIEFDYVKLQGLGLAVLGAIIAQFFMIFTCKTFRSVCRFDPLEEGSMAYPNAGIMTIPIVMATMGQEWIFYCSAYIAVQTILLWTHAKALVCNDGWNLKKILYNINIIAIFLGIILFVFNIKLPAIINTSLEHVGYMIGPMGILITGMLLADIRFIDIFSNKRAYLITFFRMIILPVLFALLLVILHIDSLHDNGTQILIITLFAVSAPPASTIVQFAQIYGRNANYASILNMLAVLICIFTMPLIILIYKTLIAYSAG